MVRQWSDGHVDLLTCALPGPLWRGEKMMPSPVGQGGGLSPARGPGRALRRAFPPWYRDAREQRTVHLGPRGQHVERGPSPPQQMLRIVAQRHEQGHQMLSIA